MSIIAGVFDEDETWSFRLPAACIMSPCFDSCQLHQTGYSVALLLLPSLKINMLRKTI